MKSIKERLRDKRDGKAWSEKEIVDFVSGVVDGRVSSAQAAAFLMAACTRGLTPEEVTHLTLAMAASGERIPKGLHTRPVVDKHSTGGVGDKVSLLLAPLAASCGLAVPMISGRGLGHTGGTVDKLESVPGMVMTLPVHRLHDLLKNHHLFMAAQSPQLAPADRILYALRDVTGTVENVGLITTSILSKKLAEGLDGLVMDVKVGDAAFMPDLAEAEDLAMMLLQVSRIAGLPLHILFTRMDRPLGRAMGNWVEVVEAETALADRTTASANLVEVTTELVAHMLLIGGLTTDVEQARNTVHEVWDSGAAHAEFHQMLRRQGGDYERGRAEHTSVPHRTVYAAESGWVNTIDAKQLALAVVEAGGGRKIETDVIDPHVGIVLNLGVGDPIQPEAPVAVITASTPAQLDVLEHAVQQALQTTTAPIESEPSMIIQCWT